jgi:hypothetical protein
MNLVELGGNIFIFFFLFRKKTHKEINEALNLTGIILQILITFWIKYLSFLVVLC